MSRHSAENDAAPCGVTFRHDWPALRIGSAHTLTRSEDGKPTVQPSISCPDCGTHGFITNGRWANA